MNGATAMASQFARPAGARATSLGDGSCFATTAARTLGTPKICVAAQSTRYADPATTAVRKLRFTGGTILVWLTILPFSGGRTRERSDRRARRLQRLVRRAHPRSRGSPIAMLRARLSARRIDRRNHGTSRGGYRLDDVATQGCLKGIQHELVSLPPRARTRRRFVQECDDVPALKADVEHARISFRPKLLRTTAEWSHEREQSPDGLFRRRTVCLEAGEELPLRLADVQHETSRLE